MKHLALLLLLALTPTKTFAGANYGFGHTLSVLVAGEVLPELNRAIFTDNPELAKWLTRVEIAAIALAWCNRERDARGTWHIQDWDELTGSYDSTMDCVGPVAAAGGIIVKDRGILINLIDIKW